VQNVIGESHSPITLFRHVRSPDAAAVVSSDPGCNPRAKFGRAGSISNRTDVLSGRRLSWLAIRELM
jgi:hypothetical protein